MGADIQIVTARASHVRPIAARMRQADVDEVQASSGRSALVALAFSYRKSSFARTVLVNGQPEMMFGVGDLNVLAGVGAPWLLGTDAVERNFRVFLRGSIDWRNQLLARYSVMRNLVDDRNVVSKRWLQWLGFRLLDPIEYRGHTFRIFEMRAGDV